MAKRFVFRLATLLRVRELREQDAERKVAAKQAEIARTERQRDEAIAAIERERQALLGRQRQAALDTTGVVRGRAWIAHQQGVITRAELQKAALRTELEKLQDAWREAHKNVRIIEKLRERRWQAHQHQVRKQTQAETDEVARRLHGSSTTLFRAP